MTKTQETKIEVIVRVRPYNRKELEQNQRCLIKVMDKTTLLFDPEDEDDEFFFQGTKQNYRDITKRVNKKLSMEFDRVFDTDSTNDEIFEECTGPLIDSVLDGYNCSVFVYGATGAGKTFTMLGNTSYPGLTFLTMRDLFNKIDAQSYLRKFDVGVSYLEVYNEHVMNLLTKTGPLKLREDSNGVVVSGLILKPIFNANDLLDLLTLGNSNRTQHPTDANAESSRSHAIFQVHIRITDRKTNAKRTVKLSMIDLAGSERAASTRGIGLRFKEGASINKSLLALGNCINKLADGNKHIPYRDSNLTRILKDSLGGNCRTLMVANVSMSSLTYEDTYNTLKYASRAKKIRTVLKQNVLKTNMPKDFYVRKVQELMDENERLRNANKLLEEKLALKQKAAASPINKNELNTWYSKMDAVYSSVLKNQEYVTGIQSKVKNLQFRIKLENESLRFNKILHCDKIDQQEKDISVITTTITDLNKQIEDQKKELLSWRRKLNYAYKDLEKLKNEIKESKYIENLQMHQKYKDLEIEYSEKNINLNHFATINAELVCNFYKLRKEFTISCELLQKSYDIHNLNGQLNSDLSKSYAELQKLMISNNKEKYKKNCIADNEQKKTSDDDISDISAIDLQLNHSNKLTKKRQLLNGNDEMESYNIGSAIKSQRMSNIDEMDLNLTNESDSDDNVELNSKTMLFKKPQSPILTHIDDKPYDLNITRVINSRSTTNNKTSIKNNLITNILSEQVIRMPPNKEAIKSVLLKSNKFTHQGLLKAVATGVQKENKKYSPNRIRKSPRNVPIRPIINAPNSLKKQSTLRSNIDHRPDQPPLVRINRAASFRVKK